MRAVCPVAGTLHGVAVHLTFPGKAPHVGSCPKSKCSVFHSGTHIRGPAFSCCGSLSSAVLKHSVRTGIPLFLPSKPSGLINEQPERAERPLGRHHRVPPASGLRRWLGDAVNVQVVLWTACVGFCFRPATDLSGFLHPDFGVVASLSRKLS